MSSLLDNLNSDFIAAFSALEPKVAPNRVLVYVESDEDIAFWRGILSQFESNKLIFDIQLPIKNALEKGKLAVLAFVNNIGKNLILCVDSDYDYLLQNTTDTSTIINNNKFIFQTYTYSIENLLCYAGSLQNICVLSSKKDTKIVDYEELLKLYSKIIYKLFVWSVNFSLKQDMVSFTIKDFSNSIKILENPNVTDKFKSALINLKDKVDLKIKELETDFPNDKAEVEALTQELKRLGVEEDNVYLFTHGHTIKDNVILMFLKASYQHIIKEREKEINNNAKNDIDKINQIKAYKNQTIKIETVLNINTEFKSCFLYKKIHDDLSQYVNFF